MAKGKWAAVIVMAVVVVLACSESRQNSAHAESCMNGLQSFGQAGCWGWDPCGRVYWGVGPAAGQGNPNPAFCGTFTMNDGQTVTQTVHCPNDCSTYAAWYDVCTPTNGIITGILSGEQEACAWSCADIASQCGTTTVYDARGVLINTINCGTCANNVSCVMEHFGTNNSGVLGRCGSICYAQDPITGKCFPTCMTQADCTNGGTCTTIPDVTPTYRACLTH
jgi:hypothetical protein